MARRYGMANYVPKPDYSEINITRRERYTDMLMLFAATVVAVIAVAMEVLADTSGCPITHLMKETRERRAVPRLSRILAGLE